MALLCSTTVAPRAKRDASAQGDAQDAPAPYSPVVEAVLADGPQGANPDEDRVQGLIDHHAHDQGGADTEGRAQREANIGPSVLEAMSPRQRRA